MATRWHGSVSLRKGREGQSLAWSSVDKQGKKMEQVNAPNGEEQTYQYDYVPMNEELVAPPIEDFAPVVENNDDVTPNVDDIFGNLKSKEMKTKPNAGDIEE